jgi:integrase/recombinase XerD
MLSYLEQRPRVPCPQVFLTTMAPLKALASQSIGAIATRAIHRAGVTSRRQGAHILRHSAATAMLGQGLSFPAIGAVLRHTSIETTMGYAKVDVQLLHHVARPWPKEASC